MQKGQWAIRVFEKKGRRVCKADATNKRLSARPVAAVRCCLDKHLKTPNLTLLGELNKLASNIALGRNFAGVHFRSDSDMGVSGGEEVAIQYIRTVLSDYGAPFVLRTRKCGLLLEKFDGTLVRIGAVGVYTNPEIPCSGFSVQPDPPTVTTTTYEKGNAPGTYEMVSSSAHEATTEQAVESNAHGVSTDP